MSQSINNSSGAGFQQFAAFVLKVEGPPGQEVGDVGGYTTWYGIIQKDVDEYDGSGGTRRRVQDISQADALAILLALYWEKNEPGLPSPASLWSQGDHALAIVLADTALNPIRGVWGPIRNVFVLPIFTADQKVEQIINIRSRQYAANAQPQFEAGLQNRLVQLRQFVNSLGQQNGSAPNTEGNTGGVSGGAVSAVASGDPISVYIGQAGEIAAEELTIIDAHVAAGLKQAAVYVGFLVIMGVCVYVIIAES